MSQTTESGTESEDVRDETVMNTHLQMFIDIVKWLAIYYTLTLIIVGCICNPLAFLVLSRRAFRHSNMSIYLRLLAVLDLGAIITGVLRYYQMRAMNYDYRKNEDLCRIATWLGNTAASGSSWTLVAVTTERVVSILWPHRVRISCSRNTSKVIVVTILAAMIVVYSPVLYIRGHLTVYDYSTNTTYTKYCVITYKRDVLNLVYFFVDGAIFAYIPCTFLSIFNVVILYGVVRSRNRVLSTKEHYRNCTDQNVNPRPEIQTENDVSKIQTSNSSNARVNVSNKETSLTLTLLVINVTFIACNLPICGFLLGPHFQTTQGMGPVGDGLSQLFSMLMSTNHALNFLLYFVTGSKFRREAKYLVIYLFTWEWCPQRRQF